MEIMENIVNSSLKFVLLDVDANTRGSNQLFDAIKSSRKKSTFLRWNQISKNVDDVGYPNFYKLFVCTVLFQV
jgi:hypothetical protein